MGKTTVQRKAPPSGVITTMFTDIVNSTKLKGMMAGKTSAWRDEKFRAEIKDPHDKIVLACLKVAEGHLVNPTGDGYCCTFTDAEEALLCALDIQDQLTSTPIVTPLGALEIRIGLHTGYARDSNGDYVASTMDKAARVQANAVPCQVFVSRETHALVSGKVQDVTFEKAGTFDLKGLESEDLYRAFRPGSANLSVDQGRNDRKTSQRTKTANKKGRSEKRAEKPCLSRETHDLENPYNFDVSANNMTFKGRATEIEELLDSIETCTHTVIYGLQRMGKTSLIEEGLREGLQGRPSLSKAIIPITIDMQGIGGEEVKYRHFVAKLISAITDKVATERTSRASEDLRGLTHELFASGRYQRGDRTEFFSIFGTLLRGFARAARRRLVLFIDEFSEIRKVIDRNKIALQGNPNRTNNLLPHDMYLDVPFIHHLGSLLKDRELKERFTLVVIVRPFMSEYDEREDLQLFKLMKPITLYQLDERAAKALITEPLQGQLLFGPGTIDYLYRLTAGHPYLLQFILKIIIDNIKRGGRRNILLDDIKFLEEQMISEGPAFDPHFNLLISDYSVDEVVDGREARLGQGALALLAKLGDTQPEGWVYQNQIFDELLKHRIPIEKTAGLLAQLTRTRILEERNAQGRLCYRFSIPLLRKRFVRQNLHLKYFR